MPTTYNQIHSELKKLAEPQRKADLQRFFKTGPGEYGEGDKFLGVTVTQFRPLVRKFKDVELDVLGELLDSSWHEERNMAALIMGLQYAKANKDKNKEHKKKLFDLYFEKMDRFNNWDLIDVSAHKVVGAYLFENKKSIAILRKLAGSKNLWYRRIAIMSSLAYIIRGSFSETLEISKILLDDKHDLIHKAVGWMLREVGNRDLKTEEDFLRTRYKKMPRTMLRYAIEKFEEKKRLAYLKGGI